ncbi:hypothetical protein SUDANB5_00350 [Streptomyces sp. SudanB5_2050]
MTAAVFAPGPEGGVGRRFRGTEAPRPYERREAGRHLPTGTPPHPTRYS